MRSSAPVSPSRFPTAVLRQHVLTSRRGRHRRRRFLSFEKQAGRRAPRLSSPKEMPNRKKVRNAFFFFVLEKIPDLRRRGLAVGGVAEAIPYCSDDWAEMQEQVVQRYPNDQPCHESICRRETIPNALSEDQKEKYAEMARQWKAKTSEVAAAKSPSEVPASFPTKTQNKVLENLTGLLTKRDQDVLETSFYFLNILSHGMLPQVCSQRFLPCEIGCIKYSLKKGIIAEFHRFIDPGEVPRGFRFHCQAAADATHKIPISGLDLPATDRSVLLCELYSFIQPCWGTWPLIYCKSDDHYRVNWCLKHMAEEAGTVNHLELRNVEDLIVELYSRKLEKEPSKTWVCSTLDASVWDYSANTRCQWHEENDVLFCALATCKKIVYCISNSLAPIYDIQLTTAHLPLHERSSSKTVNAKTVILDARRFQKAECTVNNRHTRSPHQHAGNYPAGVKTVCEPSTRCGRGIARLFPQAVQPIEAHTKVPPGKDNSF
ncbi:protein maelstrom homolog isoform X2 [Anolis carolinensis]|uniref:protein maelstrom homolog isoform X2 n=1 Tax=Anolis carolinensis TaxID=28377 RepID=UPI000462590E|nr:PREDICTED: protein maelstrom homolog isoform X2 [Anolis carolinensis]|eukprot:XP_008105915.1 PREDICTED: protein maelstrom homolog isoform X2 [Anolis carolinensis]